MFQLLAVRDRPLCKLPGIPHGGHLQAPLEAGPDIEMKPVRRHGTWRKRNRRKLSERWRDIPRAAGLYATRMAQSFHPPSDEVHANAPINQVRPSDVASPSEVLTTASASGTAVSLPPKLTRQRCGLQRSSIYRRG